MDIVTDTRRSARTSVAPTRLRHHGAAAVAWAQARPTARWLVTFGLFAVLGALWTAANPLFAGPDEPSHVASAAALAHGQLTGETPRSEAARSIVKADFGSLASSFQVVRLPASYDVTQSLNCFQAKPDTPAGCLHVSSRARTTFVPTSASKKPPLYDAAVGWAALVRNRPASATYLMRLVSALLAAAFLATAVAGLWRLGAEQLGGLGVAVAVTPMVLFLLGTVNPSSLEIAAALAVWACGLALVFETEHRVDRWLVAQLGLAAIALALARQLGPLWLGLIAVTLVVVAPRSAWRRLAGSRAAQAWLAGVIAAVAAQLVWILLYNPFDAPEAPLRLPASAIDRIVVGKGYSLFLQMIGVFGWLDTSPPSGTWLVWTLAIGGLLVLAAAFGRARFRWAIAGLVLMTVLIPMVAEAREAGHTGLYWQGRYTLPLAVGVPILAAVALIRSDRMPRLDRTGFFASVGGLLVLAQVLAYGQNLRRYIVGRNGPIQFWTGSGWSPPVPGLLLLVAFAVTMTLLTVWLLAPRPATADPPEDPVVTSSTGV